MCFKAQETRTATPTQGADNSTVWVRAPSDSKLWLVVGYVRYGSHFLSLVLLSGHRADIIVCLESLEGDYIHVTLK